MNNWIVALSIILLSVSSIISSKTSMERTRRSLRQSISFAESQGFTVSDKTRCLAGLTGKDWYHLCLFENDDGPLVRRAKPAPEPPASR